MIVDPASEAGGDVPRVPALAEILKQFTDDAAAFCRVSVGVGVAERSSASRSIAVCMARRICDEVEDAVTELIGRADFEVGRRAGYVVTDEDESTADVLELIEVFVTLLALELASLDSFDCFVGGGGACPDFELRSGISGIDSIGGTGALGGLGGRDESLRDSDVTTDGAGS